MLIAGQDDSRDAAGPAPLVSIVLCTYNGSRFLAAQVESLLAQTCSDCEILAVDDCSTDDTVAILQHHAARDARLRVVVNSTNLGFARNFATALPLSRGEFIAPCDQDDVWLPEKVAVLLAAIGSRSMAYCDSLLVDENGVDMGQRMSQVVPMQDRDDPLPFAFGNCVSGHAMLFRRALLEEALPVPDGFFHDWWLATVAAAAGGIAFCDRGLVRYRQHGTNVTGRRMAEMRSDAGLASRAMEPAPTNRVRGQRLRYLRETGGRLAAIAALPGRHREFATRLDYLWRARESQWVSPALWRMMRENSDRLLALTGMSATRRQRYCREFLWGVRARRLAHRRAYTP